MRSWVGLGKDQAPYRVELFEEQNSTFWGSREGFSSETGAAISSLTLDGEGLWLAGPRAAMVVLYSVPLIGFY